MARKISRTIIEVVKKRKDGITFRELATELGYEESFASTLSDIIRDKPGALSEDGERKLRRRLNIRPSFREHQKIGDMTREELGWSILNRMEL